ncbi:MAG: type II toxin-antitoxin system RelE/ParE family toxin [Defluviitaleaceae bacterium]|nr:type II toxin-antitoxin system RelE/ParE family toxin [Defluviitaleaceae bacterium]
MTYRVEISKKARKFINSRTSKDKKRLYDAIYRLPHGSGDTKKMKDGENEYRLRVGNYRIIYEVYKNELLVLIVEADNRGDIY